jgi:leucyl-tRNA synthetase
MNNRTINLILNLNYKWTQWIFLKLFERGLAFESEEPVNWCPKCKTVLANEDLEKGKCERCGAEVIQKKLRQWVLKMTDYADRLLYDLDDADLEWEELIKEQQRNWIGRSQGAEIEFQVLDSEFKIKVYTTRVDTIYGCTYCVVAPENPIVESLKSRISNLDEIRKYAVKAQNKTELERTQLQKEKTGVELKGIKVINPFTNEEIPVYVADYVLGFYGTGAVMAVPAHDERDWEFAKRYNLPIKESIKSLNEKSYTNKEAFVDDGILVNSDNYSGMNSEEAREKMTLWLEKEKIGKRKINYKMRDWVFSRQRYWGEPIPIIHCEKCGSVPVSEEELPLKLPDVKNYEPTETGESPLAKIDKWVNVRCPKCGGKAKRETNTMPQWAGSCWYYLRYIDPKNENFLISKEKEKYWMPVDLYVGGAEHATRHLLYARFWHKFLFDIGVVSSKEPFKKLIHVGLIDAEDGRKMSKRWGNVINPDEVISEFGVDSMRLYEMFMGPFSQNITWSTKGVSGMRRFLEKVHKLKGKSSLKFEIENRKLVILLNRTVKKVGEDIENFRFNTAISALMILVNELEKEEKIPVFYFEVLVKLLSPFAPHIAEELWFSLAEASENKEKYGKSVFLQSWPDYDESLIKEEEVELVIQVNGKLRDKIKVAADISEEEAKKIVAESEKVKNFVGEKEIKKTIFVGGKLINIVIK